MKTPKKWLQVARSLSSITILAALILPMTAHGQSGEIYVPERFGVVDIIPNNLSGEAEENSQPNLAAGTDNYFNDFVASAFRPRSADYGFFYYYSSVNGGTVWSINGYNDGVWGMSMDWSPGGTFYAAWTEDYGEFLDAGISSGVPPGYLTTYLTFFQSGTGASYENPSIRTVNVGGNDHTYIPFGDANAIAAPNKAAVFYTYTGPANWKFVQLEQESYMDSPAVRVAISPDGATVYAVFQRWTGWEGTPYKSDETGQVILMRDDTSSSVRFGGLTLAGKSVTGPIRLPYSTTLGNQSLQCSCDVAVNPANRAEVYVAYVGFNSLTGPPYIAVQCSTNGGATFAAVYETALYSGLPSLAVLNDGTVGLLYLAQNGTTLNVIFSKASHGDFTKVTSRTLASWQSGLGYQYDPYVGDYFQLRAVGANFYGIFSAYNQPAPADFPSGVYYQRTVMTGGHLHSNFWLTQSGMLYDTSGAEPVPVASSIDPFFFYDIAPEWVDPVTPVNGNGNGKSGPSNRSNARLLSTSGTDGSDPLSGTNHLIWPDLPADEPPLQLLTSSTLGAGGNWTVQTNGVIQANGQSELALNTPLPQQFFRAAQDVASGQFPTFVAVDDNGSISPGTVTNAGLSSQLFTATASNGYAVGSWYVDGAVVATGTSTYTLSNIMSEHTLMVTFTPTNAALAVSVTGAALPPGPAMVGSNYNYQIVVANNGLGTATDVVLSNMLDPNVIFQSATSSQGSVTNLGNIILANIGTLTNGASAMLTIDVVLNAETNITDTAIAMSDQTQPALTTASTIVITPLTIVTEPTNDVVTIDSDASFNVVAAGTAPLSYQWSFNGSPIPDATNATLTLSDVTYTNAGTYTVNVFQVNGYGSGSVITAASDPATLTVN